MTPDRPNYKIGLVVLVAAGFALAAVLVSPSILQNGDLYWHIASGRWIIENHAVLRIDPFSFTFTGYPWHSQGWLSQLLLALAYLVAGFGGVLVLSALAVSATTGLIAYGLSRHWQGWLLAAGILLSLGSGASAVSALPYLLALPFAVIFVMGLVAARAENRRPALVSLTALVIWANLDTSFILGLGLSVALGLEAVLAQWRLAVARDWLVFCGYALIASLLTPYGAEGLVYAIRALAPAAPVPDLTPLLLVLPAGAILLRHKATLLRAGWVALLFVLAIRQPASQLFFAAAVPLLMAEPFAQGRFRPGFALKPAVAFGVLAILGLGLRGLLPLTLADSPVTPAEVLRHVPAELLHRPVLNDAAFGGYLIMSDVRPFIDSRPHYPARFRQRAEQLGDPAVLASVLARYHIRWTLLRPANPAVKALDGLKGWKRLYSGAFAVLHVKDEAS